MYTLYAVAKPAQQFGHQQTVYERLVEVIKPSDGEIPFESLGSGSDYASFYQFVGEKVSAIVSGLKNSFTTDFFKENKKCMGLYCHVNRSVPKKLSGNSSSKINE